MEEILQAATALLLASEQSIGTTILVFLMVVTVMGLWIIGKHFNHMLRFFPSPHEEKDKFDRTLMAQAQIRETLQSELKTLSSDRLAVMQFHNGSMDLTGLGFMNFSLTFLELAPGVAVASEFVNQPVQLSLIGELLAEMWADRSNPIAIMVKRDDIQSSLLRLKMEQNGTELLAMAPITNLIGQPVGVLMAAYLDADCHRPSDSVIKTRLSASASRIAGYLIAVHAPRRWWRRRR